MAYQEKCTKCGEYWWTDKAHFCRAKETRSGSPLESVVPGRPESPSLNPDRSRDAILAELRSRAMNVVLRAEMRVQANSDGNIAYAIDSSYLAASRAFVKWIDELSEANQQHSTRHDVE
jgi:hypothetical protein